MLAFFDTFYWKMAGIDEQKNNKTKSHQSNDTTNQTQIHIRDRLLWSTD